MSASLASTAHLMPVTARRRRLRARRGRVDLRRPRRALARLGPGLGSELPRARAAPVAQAIARQAATLINPSPAFFNPPALELATRLARHGGFEHVFFGSTGAEANKGAIKLARKWGRLHRDGAHEIVTFRDGFHGRTLATMSASGKPGWDTMFAPQVDGFPKARFNDVESVRARSWARARSRSCSSRCRARPA